MERLRVVDWEHPANKDFLLVSQFSVTTVLYTYSAPVAWKDPSLSRFTPPAQVGVEQKNVRNRGLNK